jgi:hypothetical protein
MLKTHKRHFTSVQSQHSHELQEPSALTIVRVERSTTSSPRMTAIRAFRPGLTLALCLLSNVFAGMLATLMAAYLPDTVRDLTGMVDPGTVGRVGSYVGSLFLAGAPWASGGSRWATFSWLPSWAQDLGGSGDGAQHQRGTLMMVLGGGGILGGALSGYLANALGRRGTLLLSFAGSFLASGLLLLTNHALSPLVFAETAFLAVFFGISQGTLGGYIPDLFPIGVRATATGVCFNVGRGLFHRNARPRARRLWQRHCGLLRDVPARLPGDVVRPGDPRRVVDTLSPSASAVNCFQRGSGG